MEGPPHVETEGAPLLRTLEVKPLNPLYGPVK